MADLAQSMDLPEEQVVEALCAAAPPLSLTESDDDGGGQIDLPVASPEDMLSDVISLKQVVGSLEPNDRKLIVLRYFSGMTQVQTAARLGMTQVQVSRREKKDPDRPAPRAHGVAGGEGSGRASDRRDMRKREGGLNPPSLYVKQQVVIRRLF